MHEVIPQHGVPRRGGRRVGRVAGAGALAAVLVLLGTVVQVTPAFAASGDASAQGFVADLDASVLGTPVITANATVGSVVAPPTAGTNQQTLVDIAAGLGPVVGVSAVGTVDSVVATRASAAASASAAVSGVGLSVLGVSVVTASAVTAAVTCPQTGPQTATTTLTGLRLFGNLVTVDANTPGVTAEAAVTVGVLGVTSAQLRANLRRIETVTADGATATAVLVTLTLIVTVLATPITIPAGTVVIANADCERPPGAPTTTGIAPASGPISGGQTVTLTGTGFVFGGTTVTFGGVPSATVTVNGDGTSLTAVTPPHAEGTVPVVASTVAGAAGPQSYTYLDDGSGATIATIDPIAGATGGGTLVTITGTGLGTVNGVTVGGNAATLVSISGAGTMVTFRTPPSATAGVVDMIMQFPAGALPAGTFTYVGPTVTALDPAQGPIAGGTAVTIVGTGLATATGVSFGGTEATIVGTPTDTAIAVTTPAHAAGLVDVVVTLAGLDVTAPDAFAFLAPGSPTITGVSPNSGPTAGATTVVLTGTGLDTTTAVTIGANPATIVGTPTATTVTAITPVSDVAGPVAVTVDAGTGSTLPNGFTYVGPVISLVSPSSGPTAGGTDVTISGAGLAGTTAVTFGGFPATIVGTPTDVTVVATTPASPDAGPADIVLTMPGVDATSAGFTYVAPTIVSVQPSQGLTTGGTVLTITGTGLAAATSVTFDGVAGTGVSATPDGTTVTVTTPAHVASLVDVGIVLPGLDATAVDGYAFIGPGEPTITSVAPGSGPTSGGTPVTITGTGLDTTTEVTFGGVPATIVGTPTANTVTVTSPASAVAGPVIVTVIAGTGTSPLPYGFTYVAPTLTDLDPPQGPSVGGTVLTITGTGLAAATGVILGGVAATAVTASPDGTTVTATTGPHPVGQVDVTVTLPGLDVTRTNGFTYVVPGAPIVTSIAPTAGTTAGATTVILTGARLATTTSVTFGGVPATIVGTPTETSVTVSTPFANAAGPVDVTVTADVGTTTVQNGYIYQAPVIGGIDPPQGPQSGGTTITLTGTGLLPTTGVTVGGQPVSFTVNPAGTELTATTPPGSPGTAAVVVTMQGVDPDPLTYVYLYDGSAATVTDITPSTLPTSGRRLLRIAGSGLTGAVGVTFGGVPAADVVVDPGGAFIDLTAPPQDVAGPAAVVIVFPAGTRAAGTVIYVAPSILAVSPQTGPASGGTIVTITGSGLEAATGVRFGGRAGRLLEVSADGTSLRVLTPAQASGDPAVLDVVVELPGVDAVIHNGFRYTADGLPITGDPVAGIFYLGLGLLVLGLLLTGLLAIGARSRRTR